MTSTSSPHLSKNIFIVLHSNDSVQLLCGHFCCNGINYEKVQVSSDLIIITVNASKRVHVPNATNLTLH